MRVSSFVLILVLGFSPILGCGGGPEPAEAVSGDELSQFLADNPDIANEEEEEEEEDEE